MTPRLQNVQAEKLQFLLQNYFILFDDPGWRFTDVELELSFCCLITES
jgi:hypothetical protein